MSYDFQLTDDEKRELLRIARATLKEYLFSGRVPPGAPHRKSLTAPAGVHVVLHGQSGPRGASGNIQENTPLYKAIQENAIGAATRDPRFEPIKVDELAQLVIEISVVCTRSKISSPGDLVLGTHGVMVQVADRRGLLMPSVATDNHWDSEVFLAQACSHAGLPELAWKSPEASVETFTVQGFNERDLPAQSFAFAPRR
ncbi:MAG: AmmeMemoRadiSam system protein A [Deltaproteobacteria bacterium]|nr:AmmeMemoRadiSam system protein A [Deltaproteobacteria bacterium]